MRRNIVTVTIGFVTIFLRNTDETEANDFLLKSPKCQIPDFDPYDPSVRGFIWKLPPLNCSSLPPLTSIVGNYKGRRTKFSHTLRLHKSRFPFYRLPKDGFWCCYRLITRDSSSMINGEYRPDDGYKFSECFKFDRDVKFVGSEEMLWVKCQPTDTSKVYESYVNMHAFVSKKPAVLRKLADNSHSNKLSVMIVGIDAVSRLNLQRTMPKTVGYLKRRGWIEMNVLNKMDDNTFPNVMATLTGMKVTPNDQSCTRGQTFLDDCPLIWKDFSAAGYVTAYVEDEPFIGSFNYLKKGFHDVPTDYYLRPFFIAGYWNTNVKILAGRVGCFGPTKVADHIFNYALDFKRTFRNHPSFSMFWQNGFSHDDVNTPSALDDTVMNFFKNLTATGTLNTTMVIFMSDHGMRAGNIRSTFQGYLEERLPFLYLWVPHQLEKVYPRRIANLKENRNRLISHFDIYMTFADVLGKTLRAPGCPKCMSLFDRVPWIRSCTDAGIQDHWCTCAEYADLHTTHPFAVTVARFVVNEINSLLQRYTSFVRRGSKCAKLSFSYLVSLRKKTSSNGVSQMVAIVQTYPGDGQFEATVSYEGGLRVTDSISRTNMYGDQSKCVDHHNAKKYCYCQSVP